MDERHVQNGRRCHVPAAVDAEHLRSRPGRRTGALLGSVTQTFNIPFRPSANKKCTGGDAGKWYHAGTCFNGKATRSSSNAIGLTLPAKAIISVAYSTSDYGASPKRPQTCNKFNPERCPYDSLNVGLIETSPSVGSNPIAELDYVGSLSGEQYGGFGTVGTFSLADIETESAEALSRNQGSGKQIAPVET